MRKAYSAVFESTVPPQLRTDRFHVIFAYVTRQFKPPGPIRCSAGRAEARRLRDQAYLEAMAGQIAVGLEQYRAGSSTLASSGAR